MPACGKCNQSKGNKVWREWMLGSARLSPASRRIPDLAERVRALSAFEHWRTPEPLDLESLVGRELWQEYWTQRDQLLDQMDSCQRLAEKLRERVLERIIAEAAPFSVHSRTKTSRTSLAVTIVASQQTRKTFRWHGQLSSCRELARGVGRERKRIH